MRLRQSYHARALVPTQECKDVTTGSSGFRRTGVVIAAGAIGTNFLDRISRGRIGEPRIGAYALGPVVIVHVGLGADHGAVGAAYRRCRPFRRPASKNWSSSRGSACSCRPARRPRSSPASITPELCKFQRDESGPVGEYRASLGGPVGGTGGGVGTRARV
jgi:hypothetical protein